MIGRLFESIEGLAERSKSSLRSYGRSYLIERLPRPDDSEAPNLHFFEMLVSGHQQVGARSEREGDQIIVFRIVGNDARGISRIIG